MPSYPEHPSPSLIDSYQQGTVVINSSGIVASVNKAWRQYGISSGLSPRFNWTGTSYFELMSELILPPERMGILRSAVDSLFNKERLTFSGRFPKPPFLTGEPVFRIEAIPLIQDKHNRIPYVLLAHRYVSTQRIRPGLLPAKRPFRQRHRFLPVCASCKSVRVGKNWILIEQYLREQLHAELTHDICPRCIHELYPQYAGALSRYAE